MSSSLSFLDSFARWNLIPLISSSIDSLYDAVMPVSAKISDPSLGSAIPSKNFYFLEVLVAGRLVIRKFFNVLETLF